MLGTPNTQPNTPSSDTAPPIYQETTQLNGLSSQRHLTQNVAQEKMHYESLISLFKYCITAISVVATVVGYLLFQNGQEMRTQLKEDRKYVESQVAELKQQVKDQKDELNKSAEDLHTDLRKDVADFKDGAMTRIGSIEEVATNQARNRINEIFREKNFDEFVDDVARERMEPRIQGIVDQRLDSLEQLREAQIQTAIRDLADITFGIQQRGLTILQSITVHNLKDSHLNLIVKQIEPDKMDVSIYLGVKSLLAGKKSKTADAYFMRAFLSKPGNIYDAEDAILYFVRFENTTDFYSKLIENTKDIRYGQMIANTSFHSNKPLFAALMRNERFLNTLFSPSTIVPSDPNIQAKLKEELRNNYKESFPNANLQNIYLFNLK